MVRESYMNRLKDAALLLVYFIGVLLLGALLSPLLFFGGQSLAARGILPFLAAYDFESYFHRALLVSALLLIWPLLRALRIQKWRELQLTPRAKSGRDLLAGFLIAAIPLLCCGAIILAIGIYEVRGHIVWKGFLPVALAAIFVPLIEETFFRGFVLGVLLRRGSSTFALVFTSALFSIVHFLKAPDETTSASAVSWFSGFSSIAAAFWQFRDPMLVLGGFGTLFVVGWVLGDARLRTRALWLPIGLHAGWIFANGAFNRIAHRQFIALPWIGKSLLVGIVPIIVGLASWIVMLAWLKHERTRNG
jgi:membrane protease YdiL (CAAX protease family)